MDDKNELEKSVDDIMLPGFRFHPTDEELVGYYLKRKLLHRALPIELIKQVDIYKYDPWDLPKFASSTGEKEWYFYCPRDRKYRNSTRPNRVTGSGFWKATGTDRPIYSSDGAKCIGLKKSLVFYRGRAAKGMKTDWMMHEFRLSSATDGAPPPPPKKIFDKNFPASDSWAICRIFKKTNSTANRPLSVAWAPPETTTSPPDHATQILITSDQFQHPNNFSSHVNTNHLSAKPYDHYFHENLLLSPDEEATNRSILDPTAMFFNLTGEPCKNSDVEVAQHHGEDEFRKNQMNSSTMWEKMGFPFSLPWDSPPCPTEISSSTYSTNKCYI